MFLIAGVNAGGFLAGEWTGVAPAAVRKQVAGVALLLLSSAIVTVRQMAGHTPTGFPQHGGAADVYDPLQWTGHSF